MFKPEITSHSDRGVPAQSITIEGHGYYDVRTDTLALVTEHLAHYTVRELRSRMTAAFHAFEGKSENPMLAGLRRAELLFIAAEYPSLYLPGMVQALSLTVDAEGRYWVPPTPEADQDAEPTTDAPASPFVADPANPTDAELAAAIQRGLATGQLVDATDWLAAQRAQRAQDAIQASAARHGHATTCTAHGGRDLAACDPADCDEAALAASFTVTVSDTEARREHDEAGPGHAAWCAGPSTHIRATRSATVPQRTRAYRGHFHDPLGLYDFCTDPTCTRVIA